jgi:CubicO group peptidase (beta-lactamase class C family)
MRDNVLETSFAIQILLGGTMMKVNRAALCARGLVVLLAIFSQTAAYARNHVPISKPERVGMSSERLELMPKSMQNAVDQGKFSGVVTLVARQGKVVRFDAVGKQDIEANKPMAKDSIFRIYSMTKPITGVAMMILFEQGKWQLNDPVAKFIPEFKDLKVHSGTGPDGKPNLQSQAHPMTMRELMSHTAGFTYGFFSNTPVDALQREANVLDNDITLAEMIRRVAQLPLNSQPGAQWQYSISVDIQGYIVEKLSGMPFDQFLAKHLFEPLRMVDTGFYVPADKLSRLAQVYNVDAQGKLKVETGGFNRDYSKNPALLSGGGGLVSTASDYFRFCQMLLNRGVLDGVRILSPLTVELMRTNAIGDNSVTLGGRGTKFGLDFAIYTDPVAAGGYYGEGTYWWGGAAGTWFWIDPVRDLIVIGMIQHLGAASGAGAAGMPDLRGLSHSIAYGAIVE